MKTIYTTLICAALAFAGCGDDHDHHDGHDHGGQHADTHEQHDGGTEPTAVEVTNALTISDWLTEEALEGVNVCVNDESLGCELTDAEGKVSFTASVTKGDVIEVRASKEGYFSFLVQGVVADPVDGETYETGWVLASTDSLSLVTSVLDGELDEAKGHATVGVLGPADAEGVRTLVSGATVELTGTAEFGPKYLNTAEDLGSAGPFGDDAAGTTAAGLVAFFNVDPGTIHLKVNVEGHVCTFGAAGLPSDTATVSGLVDAGHVSYLFATCEVSE